MRLPFSLTIFLAFIFHASTALSGDQNHASVDGITFTSEITRLNATTSGSQINPSIASLPDDRFVMTWSDRAGNDGDKGGIFGRMYDAMLTPLAPEFVVNTLTSDWQSLSKVASAQNGAFMAIWHQSNHWVEGQLFSASGEKQGPQFTVHQGYNGSSDIVADSFGNFWVVSSVNAGSAYISQYSNTGEVLLDSLVFQSDVEASNLALTALLDGRILVVWHDGQNPSGSEIYAQFITAEGTLSGEPFVINSTTQENQSMPDVAALSSGGFVVVWQSLLQDGDLAGVYVRVFDSAGEGGPEILVNAETTGNQFNASVTARSDGGFVVGWIDANSPRHAYFQAYNSSAHPLHSNQIVSSDDTDVANISLAELADGSMLSVWDAWNLSRDIYGRTFKVITYTGTDSDNDGIIDDIDNCPSIANEDQADNDSDGEGDVCDADDDNDGTNDEDDAFPFDDTESLDTDGDGIGNNEDYDDDADGILDSFDNAPLVMNAIVVDSDNDGVIDSVDAYPNDPTKQYSGSDDIDGDGWSNDDEVDYCSNPFDKKSEPNIGGLSLPLIHLLTEQ